MKMQTKQQMKNYHCAFTKKSEVCLVPVVKELYANAKDHVTDIAFAL